MVEECGCAGVDGEVWAGEGSRGEGKERGESTGTVVLMPARWSRSSRRSVSGSRGNGDKMRIQHPAMVGRLLYLFLLLLLLALTMQRGLEVHLHLAPGMELDPEYQPEMDMDKGLQTASKSPRLMG